MAHKSSFDQEAKKKAIDKAMPEDKPKKGSVKHIAATAGNWAARGMKKVGDMPTPVDAAITAGKSFKKTLRNKATRELEQEGDPRALQEKASKKKKSNEDKK